MKKALPVILLAAAIAWWVYLMAIEANEPNVRLRTDEWECSKFDAVLITPATETTMPISSNRCIEYRRKISGAPVCGCH